jgi:hypothetical protein
MSKSKSPKFGTKKAAAIIADVKAGWSYAGAGKRYNRGLQSVQVMRLCK